MFFNAAARSRFSSSSSLTAGLQDLSRKCRAFDPRADLCEGRFPIRGGIVAKGGEAAVVGGTQLFKGDEPCCFEHAITHLFGRLDPWVDRRDYADKYALMRLQVV